MLHFFEAQLTVPIPEKGQHYIFKVNKIFEVKEIDLLRIHKLRVGCKCFVAIFMKQVSANFQSVVLVHPSTPGFNWFIASVASLPAVGNVFDGDRVVVVDVKQVENLLHETFEKLRS